MRWNKLFGPQDLTMLYCHFTTCVCDLLFGGGRGSHSLSPRLSRNRCYAAADHLEFKRIPNLTKEPFPSSHNPILDHPISARVFVRKVTCVMTRLSCTCDFSLKNPTHADQVIDKSSVRCNAFQVCLYVVWAELRRHRVS